MSKLLDFLGGGVIKEVGGILDNLTTTKEEKLEAKRKIQELLAKAEAAAQEQVSRRWEADMKSDNWLSKNIRPLTLAFLTVILVILSFLDGNVGGFVMDDAYKPIYQTLLITVYGAYFAGRSIEKIRKTKKR
jgi:peptidoglycan/LPS O-acetylase OafA/YrhL|tara:strand:- start:203 stop:598 length:396 start_codon:yes stop_codon:yes gene_type:complete